MRTGSLFGLIGYPLSHSFSKRYFTAKFAAEGLSDRFAYELFPLTAISELPALLQAYPQLRGLNVTLPYKSAVIPYLSSCAAEVDQMGAVNVIDITSEGLRGYNTDVVGFEVSLRGLLQKAAAGDDRAGHGQVHGQGAAVPAGACHPPVAAAAAAQPATDRL